VALASRTAAWFELVDEVLDPIVSVVSLGLLVWVWWMLWRGVRRGR